MKRIYLFKCLYSTVQALILTTTLCILINIYKLCSPLILSQHAILRQIAERNTEKARKEIKERLLSKGNVTNKNLQIGTTVTIVIPQIDQYGVDRSLLPCRIIESQMKNISWGCASRILSVTYGANELNLVELAEISQRIIGVRGAARGQSVVGTASNSQIRCMCKGACTDGRCSCRKSKQKCTTKCHKSSVSCLNY